MGMVHRKSPPVRGTFSLRKILILAENDGGAGEREGRDGDGDSNEVIGAGGGVLLVIGLGGVLGRAVTLPVMVWGKSVVPLFLTLVVPFGVIVAVTSWDSLPSR